MPVLSPSVLILVVSYRNNAQLLRFLTQKALLSAPSSCSLSIVTVANGLSQIEQVSLRAATEAQQQKFPLTLLASDANPGYFGGAAKGLAAHLASHPQPDWVIVTNDDIYFADDFFDKLASQPFPSDTGVLAPDTIVHSSGIHQNPFLLTRPKPVRVKALLFLYRHPFIFRAVLAFSNLRSRLGLRTSRPAITRPTDIYAPHGACMLMHSRYFAFGGTLNHFAFLYAEEYFVAEACQRMGLRVRYVPYLIVEHHEHSAMRLVPSRLHRLYMREAAIAMKGFFFEHR